jgi:hypothetical protein
LTFIFAVPGVDMSLRVQIYLLLAGSLFGLFFGIIGVLLVVFVFHDSRGTAFTMPIILIGLLGLQLTCVISRLSDRIERLERAQGTRSREQQ